MVQGEEIEFYRGAIQRIRIQNFMTYTDMELKPGPNLNMILGPNGTGKSAVVCCIIVGLAGDVSLTGRGANVTDFVKKNTNVAITEIELFNDRGSNYVVQRKISILNRSQFKIDSKNEWFINRRPATKAAVQELTKKLNIKVDNLCQFLPQDSVTQFVKMNPAELLSNTLKAAGDIQLVDDYGRLVNYTKEVEEKRTTLRGLKKSCEENEVNAKRLESEVHQLRQREALVKQKNLCNQKLYYLRYQEAKTDFDNHRKELDKLKNDLAAIESQSEPYKQAIERYKQQATKVRAACDKSSAQVRASMDTIDSIQTAIHHRKTIECQEEFNKFKQKQEAEAARESNLKLKHQEIRSLKERLESIRDVDCSTQIHKLDQELDSKKREMMNLKCLREKKEDLCRKHLGELDILKENIEQIKAVRQKKINLLKERYNDNYKALEWLARNSNRFKQKVFSPLFCEINVKDPKYNCIVENAITNQELISFLCLNPEDVKTFTRSLREELKLNINVVLVPDKTMEDYEQQSAQLPDLREFGIVANLIDLIEAPEPIKRYLCGSRNFHRIPVADSCNEQQYKQLKERCPVFYVGREFYQVTKSRFDKQAIITSDEVREARLIHISLDAKRLSSYQTKYQQLQSARELAMKDQDDYRKKEDETRQEWQELAEKQRDLKRRHDEKKRLQTMITLNQQQLEKLQGECIDIEFERTKLQRAIEKINGKIVDDLESLSNAFKKFVKLKALNVVNALHLHVVSRNVKRSNRKYNKSLKDTTRLTNSIKAQRTELSRAKESLEEKRKLAEERVSGFSNDMLEARQRRKFEAIEENTVDQLREKSDELQVRIQRIYKDSSILAEFERQNELLRDKQAQIQELEEALVGLQAQREKIKATWLPSVQEVVEVINNNYQDFMQKLSYDGKVKLDFNPEQPDNFGAYGIKILVRYRDEEDLIPLSATRQSGGERSVATMIYMLALQTKTSVPFRCVDEINQGMDKENERKVFELLVQTADSSSSQYFLVSPKLLTNLPYSEKMKIHVIYNGKKLAVAWSEMMR